MHLIIRGVVKILLLRQFFSTLLLLLEHLVQEREREREREKKHAIEKNRPSKWLEKSNTFLQGRRVNERQICGKWSVSSLPIWGIV